MSHHDDDLADLMTALGLLHANGQSTAVTLDIGTRLARHFGRDLILMPGWNGVAVLDNNDPLGALRLAPGQPAAVNMRRVAATITACEDLLAGKLPRADFRPALDRAGRLPASGDLAFAGAAALGAVALAVIFGGDVPASMLLIALAAGLGGLLRRRMGALGASGIWQAFAAALLAGLFGALADHLHLTSAQRLVAVCPCMVLVPGPHLLNGCFDIVAGRIQIGMARLGLGIAILAGIAAGVVAGLLLGGSSLPPAEPVGSSPLLWDIPAAAAAALAYSVFFSAPPRLYLAPMLVGAAAHGVRWLAMHDLAMPMYLASGLACLIVGAVLAPLALRRHLPFAAIGFAAVVALVPGLFAFRAMSALFALTSADAAQRAEMSAILATDLATFLVTTGAMAAGLMLPLAVARAWARHSKRLG
ncbi:MAG: threonine/serine exporter family protein [Paracoccus sp. (in: a-proteobacteria)]|uniref:threonine/serine exporter family protein n=1 Tax=Paracoccus sp. TaxID=267 RepID=UPI0026DF450D|nr:threonine/serine exporter family protein [Paracoccus sp. (in: a-proteobacteria)]MDO5632644.1 threonine/serine exporter family protein [Paracoccus sp. (in: a-proteobacteria)]